MTATRERPILFSGPMVRAILDEKKAQTRRVVKSPFFQRDVYTADRWTLAAHPGGGWWGISSPDFTAEQMERYCKADGVGFSCPYGVPGDRLWVRETWGVLDDKYHRVAYRADEGTACGRHVSQLEGRRWRPSIHMHRFTSRLTLELTGVRVERVQDITNDDCRAEGISDGDAFAYAINDVNDYPRRQAYRALWDSLNAARGYGWDVNPWVWVLDFSVVRP